MPSHSSRPILVLLFSLLVVVSAQATFVFNDTTGVNTLVDFNQFTGLGPWGTRLTDAPVEVFNSGGLTVNMGVPNYGESFESVRYGRTTLNLSGVETTDPYLVNNSSASDAANQQVLEFTFVGGAVSAVGLRLSAIAGQTTTNVLFEAFDIGGNLVDSFLLTSSSTPANLASLNTATNNPDDGNFYGLSVVGSQIVSFRITGGILAMDDLQFGGLSLNGGTDPGGDPDPDPGSSSAVPEPSTYLLCGAALAMLALGTRKKQATSKS